MYLSDYAILAAKGIFYPDNQPLWYGVSEDERKIVKAAVDNIINLIETGQIKLIDLNNGQYRLETELEMNKRLASIQGAKNYLAFKGYN